MPDIIVLAGAPGSGKTTIAEILHKNLPDSIHLDFGWLREWHLDRSWSNASPKEERMSFENLIFIVRNYLEHNYSNIIITDLLADKVRELPQRFPDNRLLIITLVVDESILKKRVLDPNRNSGFRNVERALNIQEEFLSEPKLDCEIRLDNNLGPDEIINHISSILSKDVS